jgi:hypothetical protein
MKTISLKQCLLISIEPMVKRVKRFFLDRHIDGLDRAIESLDRSIRNDQSAKSVLQKDRMMANNRRNSLR